MKKRSLQMISYCHCQVKLYAKDLYEICMSQVSEILLETLFCLLHMHNFIQLHALSIL